ncbi:MAG TPA: hypothetical protein VGQ52_03090 [Gemmatimonadaceae bacterium]|nr:hypothetical protein [Gemmatimonadaceae bacterium]
MLAADAHGRAVLIVGHGPNSAEDYAAWMTNLRTVADSVRLRGGLVAGPTVKKSTGYGVFILEEHSQQLNRRHLFAS